MRHQTGQSQVFLVFFTTFVKFFRFLLQIYNKINLNY